MSLHYYTPDLKKEVFFCSDPHAYHKNICTGISSWSDKSVCRNFADENIMTQKLSNNINSLVNANDILICLGDWSFGLESNISKFREMINCKEIVLILGNHDKKIEKNPSLYRNLFVRVLKYNEFRIRGTLICQFHYPIASWNEIGNDSWMLHGHCHGSYNGIGKIIDVGFDCNNLLPYHISQINNIMDSKKFEQIDHHGNKTVYY